MLTLQTKSYNATLKRIAEQMRTSDLRLTILKTFRGREFYGYDIHKKLASEGTRIEVGRLYRVLNQMLRDEWLESRWEKSPKGPKKKLYKLGKKGKEELDKILIAAIQTIHRAYGEYLFSLPLEKSVFPTISKEIVGKKAGQSNIALIAEDSSPMYQRLLDAIQNKLPASKIFLVKPKTVTMKLQLENAVILEGNLQNIPLKDNYVDLLITANMPLNQNVERATKEWRRVLSRNGRLAVISPNVLFGLSEDPLTIGDFIEKWEHQTYEERDPREGQYLLNCIQRDFQNVKEVNVVHMKLVLAENP